MAFGNYSGGVLVVDNETIDTFQKAVVMDGSKEHFVTPHVGDRWSLIIFLHSKAHTLPNSDKLTLKKVGFMLDSPSDPHCPPPEATVSEVERGHFPVQALSKQGALQDVNAFPKVHFHRLGDAQSADALVYERADKPRWGFGAQVTDDGRHLVLGVWNGTSRKNGVFVAPSSSPINAGAEARSQQQTQSCLLLYSSVHYQ